MTKRHTPSFKYTPLILPISTQNVTRFSAPSFSPVRRSHQLPWYVYMTDVVFAVGIPNELRAYYVGTVDITDGEASSVPSKMYLVNPHSCYASPEVVKLNPLATFATRKL